VAVERRQRFDNMIRRQKENAVAAITRTMQFLVNPASQEEEEG
jgi:hypothetical protein